MNKVYGKHMSTKVLSRIYPQRLQPFIDQKLISVRKHPELNLYVYNYTNKCQYDSVWTQETMMCRGLILDGDGNIVARPFKKFFNLQEHLVQSREIPKEPFEVYDKLDGSLGILYFHSNRPHLATRGSFTSEQAVKGTEILHNKYSNVVFDPKLTYLFEIIYPENKIVVDYKGVADIFLLAIINTQTGEEKPYSHIRDECGGMLPIVERFDVSTNLNELTNTFRDNREGYVVHFPKSGLRLKLKHDEYVRVHRLVTGINNLRIWEYLKDKQPLDELLDRVPDEFYTWASTVVNGLNTEYQTIERETQETLQVAKQLSTRKDQALLIKQSKYPHVIFSMLDKKDYSEKIWKIIKPKSQKPFREDEP